MYRILLIDDEPLVRMTIKSLGQWEKFGFVIACEAYDGVDALNKMKTEKSFDIILTDVSMPKMNGIEVIHHIRELDNQIPIIVLSAFNDYQFVREAFKLGIQDYILKSDVSFESLLKLLQKSTELISAAKQNYEEIQDNHFYLKQKFLEDLLNGNIHKDLESKLNTYQVGFPKSNITVSVFSIDDYKVMEAKYDSIVLTNINQSILNVFAQKIAEYKLGEIIVIAKGKYAFISGIDNEKSSAILYQKLNNFLNNVKHSLLMFLNISVTIGVSNTQDGYEHLPDLYAQALAANELKLIYAKGKIFYQHDLSHVTNTSQGSLAGKEKDLIYALFSEDERNVKTEINKIFDYTRSLNLLNINKVYSLYLEFIYIILGHLNRKDIYSEDIFKNDINFLEQISKFETIDEINQYVEHILLAVLGEIGQRNENVPSKIKKAKEFMKLHFNKDITLKFVSEHIQVSEAYLSRLFSSETGENFINYLTRLRIDAAKDLLNNGQLTINQISERVGYANQEHFSRIFKKHVGCSPNKYRNEDCGAKL